MPISLLIADDHELVRQGLRYTFAGTDIEIVAEAATPAEALRRARDPGVDVVLLDVSWWRGVAGGLDGFDLLAEIRALRPRVAVLMYSIFDRVECVERCRRLGGDGYLVKGIDDRRLPAAVRAAYAGRQVWPGQRMGRTGATGVPRVADTRLRE